ncbi:urea active transporter [Apiospora saccharicola]|uniref:Urea active transporter n=1 Tax=Apiospora saccharicola TaxID=335842 RepID=A0ABR1TMH1_9PEZI
MEAHAIAARRPVCDICRVKPTAHQSAEEVVDGEDGRYYEFTSFCEGCWETRLLREEPRNDARDQRLALHKERIDKMMEHVESPEPAEQVPLDYAVQKCTS